MLRYKKIRIISRFIDTLLYWRLWNFKMITSSTMKYIVFRIMKACRRQEPKALVTILKKQLNPKDEGIGNRSDFSVHQRNGRVVKFILARLTAYIETRSGKKDEYGKYITSKRTQAFEVEHVLSHRFEDYKDLFTDQSEYEGYRNRIGALLLLPKSDNASYGDMEYNKKREYYNSQNILARTLHEKCYSHNPGFLKFKKESGLNFTPHQIFDKKTIEQRQELYIQLAKMIWNIKGLDEELKIDWVAQI